MEPVLIKKKNVVGGIELHAHSFFWHDFINDPHNDEVVCAIRLEGVPSNELIEYATKNIIDEVIRKREEHKVGSIR